MSGIGPCQCRTNPLKAGSYACYILRMIKVAAAALIVLATLSTTSNAAPPWQEPETSTTWRPPSEVYRWQFHKQDRTLSSFNKQALLNNKKIAVGKKLPVLAMTCSWEASSTPARKRCTPHADPELVLVRLAPTMRVAQSCFDYEFIAPTDADLHMAQEVPLNYTKLSANGTRAFAVQSFVTSAADKDSSARVSELFEGIGPDQDFSVANASVRAHFLVPVTSGAQDPGFAEFYGGDLRWSQQAFTARAFAQISLEGLSKDDKAAILYNQAIAWHQVGDTQKSAAAVAALRKLKVTFPPDVSGEISTVLAFFKAIEQGKQLATSPCNFVRPIRSATTVDPVQSPNATFAAASAGMVRLQTTDWPSHIVRIQCSDNSKNVACKFLTAAPANLPVNLLRDVEASLQANHRTIVSVPPDVALAVQTQRNVEYRVYETGCESAWKAHHPCDPIGSTATNKFTTKVETISEMVTAARLLPWQAEVFLPFAMIGHREKGLWVPDPQYSSLTPGASALASLEKLRTIAPSTISVDERLALSLWTAVVALHANAPDAKNLVAQFVVEAKRRPLAAIHFELRPLVVQSLWTMEKIDRGELVRAP